MTNANAAHKIARAHQSRKAVVYLRQSSLAQVKRNTESQRLQYALADTAKLYGFRHIEVIDRDLGLAACTDGAMPYVRERRQFDQPLGEFRLVQGKVADMYSTMNACRAYVHAVAAACDRGETTRKAGRSLWAGLSYCVPSHVPGLGPGGLPSLSRRYRRPPQRGGENREYGPSMWVAGKVSRCLVRARSMGWGWVGCRHFAVAVGG